MSHMSTCGPPVVIRAIFNIMIAASEQIILHRFKGTVSDLCVKPFRLKQFQICKNAVFS